MSSKLRIDEHGTKWWYNEKGELHRDGDLPAVEFANGTKWWYKHGKLHRDGDKPAVEYADGTRMWWKNGQLHRDRDLPAIESPDGTKLWYKNGKDIFGCELVALKRKWTAIRNRDTDILSEELLDSL